MSKDAFDQFEKRIEEHFKAFHGRLDALPCAKHQDDIHVIYQWQDRAEKEVAYWKGVGAAVVKATAVAGGAAGVAAGLAHASWFRRLVEKAWRLM